MTSTKPHQLKSWKAEVGPDLTIETWERECGQAEGVGQFWREIRESEAKHPSGYWLDAAPPRPLGIWGYISNII